MYLTGFGYAGMTIPKLALNIYEHNNNPRTPGWLKMNIDGLLLFNPCTYPYECGNINDFTPMTIRALRDHFFISKSTYEDYKTYCTLRTSQCDRV